MRRTVRKWKKRVREVYSSLEELRGYDSIYKIAEWCGYTTPEKLWRDNPFIQGSTDPADFGVVRQPKAKGRR